MTDEQTKQNAEEYAKKIYPYTVGKAAAIRDFIAGAHSLDDEIKELEQALACAEDVVDTQRKELEKLRNPWISVEERLPRKLRKKNYSKEVLCRADGGTLLVSIYNYKKCEWTDGIYIKITHWMPIPKVKKGE